MILRHDWRVSRLALDADTGRVAGVCLCDMSTAERTSQALTPGAAFSTETRRISRGFFQQLGEDYDVFQALDIEKVLHLNITVVDRR